ncbi:MAG: universal stress protein [Usitatibacter sp.]
MKILLAADGSQYTRRAARYLAAHANMLKDVPEIHVLHVHQPIPYTGAAAVIGKKAIEAYYKAEADTALAVAEAEFKSAGIATTATFAVGDVAAETAAYVKKNGIDLVVMGSRGHGALAGLALGSVATKLIYVLEVPVMVVR